MRTVLYKAAPWNKEDVLLALESGVDGLICPDKEAAAAATLARCAVLPESEVAFVKLASKSDEERAAELAYAVARNNSIAAGKTAKAADTAPGNGKAAKVVAASDTGNPSKAADTGLSDDKAAATSQKLVVLCRGWEIIPLENLLAGAPGVAVEAGNLDEAVLAAGVLERGADTIILTPEALPQIKEIVASLKYSMPRMELSLAEITAITPAGMGHRVCVDTASLLQSGQGMLVGNSAAFTFLVNAETERNEYVAARPFRINAGGVHAYTVMPKDRTAYLEELAAGREVLIVGHDGATSLATVGRVKVERRPMLLVEARLVAPLESPGPEATPPFSRVEDVPATTVKETAITGAVFLQNAETIRLVRPDGRPVSVVELKPGDRVLCRTDVAGRHFGMRIAEDIKEG